MRPVADTGKLYGKHTAKMATGHFSDDPEEPSWNIQSPGMLSCPSAPHISPALHHARYGGRDWIMPTGRRESGTGTRVMRTGHSNIFATFNNIRQHPAAYGMVVRTDKYFPASWLSVFSNLLVSIYPHSRSRWCLVFADKHSQP